MKKILTVLLLFLVVTVVFGCTEMTFGDLKIVAADVADVPAGEYTLRYSIAGYEDFLASHPNLTLSVNVVDEDNEAVDVRNNRTIVVEKGKTYTVNVALVLVEGDSVKNQYKQFVVTAERIPPKVSFFIGTRFLRAFELEYGGSLGREQVDGIVNRDYSDLKTYPESGLSDGYSWGVVSQKWVVGSPESTTILSAASYTDVKKDVNIYLVREIVATGIAEYRYVYHNDGGTETPDTVGSYMASVVMPAIPTKSGFVFGGWYVDPAFSERFDWTLSSHLTLTKNYDLYARWYPASDPVLVGKFEYEYYSADNEGYPYALVKRKSGATYAGALALPIGAPDKNGNDNILVKGFCSEAFESCPVTSVTIPATYCDLTLHAFRNCTELTTVVFADHSQQTFLDEGTFSGCTALSSINLPAGLTLLGVEAFKDCSSLPTIDLPAGLLVINESCFAGCVLLTEVTIPDTVYTINEYAFSGCTNLSSIAFSADSDLVSIYADSLENTAVTEIVLPYTLYEDEYFPFDGTGIDVSYYPKKQE